ncbi:TRAP transporter small permease [Novosphingobium taihuense]|uniref:TRAP transporter small permease protein n=1 Tax=Novosphingobium taihuense TaxID=260085 RepID=A0A7W7EVD4_9SPHN|nr:TRAP transporter small permease subunit [Novosphingobium taihuense]MBB4614956.1 TRAP-type C4-dicarboxylate transport system permease small subunit [Novosphingobium taihuense]TWH84603.1 TRAP-type C4-dicarboxylate transport system permease small subunit [Novosphingobium taihuense]
MSVVRKAIILIGGIALLGATATDTVAVIGRHIGLPLRGSIELVQLFVLIAGSLALLVATAEQAHAKVHMVVDRMGDAGKAVMARLSGMLGAVFFAGLLAGSLWLMADLWNGHEQSELLGISWRLMRLFANLALLTTIAVLLNQAVRGRK